MASIVIADTDKEWVAKLKEYFEKYQYEVSLVDNGKKCQIALANKKHSAIILDFSIKDHSSISVLKYIKINCPSLRVIFTLTNLAELEEIGLSKSDLKHLGVYDIVEKPTEPEQIFKLIELYNNPTLWNKIERTGETKNEENVDEPDDNFDKISSKTFFSGNTTIYDIYIRLKQDKYVKVLHRGDVFDQQRLDKYINEKNVEFFYFKKEDRILYINFMNKLLSKVTNTEKISQKSQASLTKTLTDKYINEVFTGGMNPRVVEEGKAICENIHGLLARSDDMKKLLDTFLEMEIDEEGQSFLVSFFSIAIGKELNWVTERSVQTLGMGGMLHDIGKIKLPDNIRNKKFSEMTDEEKEIYKTHPQLGVELLQDFPFLPEPVRQIVLQHHERLDGSGYPHRLTGMKIFPMAKVIAIADEFVNQLVETKMSPVEVLNQFIRNEELMIQFDSNLLRSFLKSFISNNKKIA
ncbi:MAG: HD domain-containing protein [Halobacteriovoraceae bacterium]|nr:HD domain-containing protein [Halobacteriovoraceae bacterium]MCB9095229.1 HD domain-containing protein [Halobacteriovoraceae bacterium]